MGGINMPNRYDHRPRNAIVETGNPNLFPELSIPSSTARDWIRKGKANVITASEFECTQTELAGKVRELEVDSPGHAPLQIHSNLT